ncbi:MAG: hypothetical protein ACYDA9_19790 [Terriglobia bacterium]
MPNNLGRIQTKRKTGSERVTSEGTDLGFALLGFWQWSRSDLVSNATRGVLAEYIVAKALGIDTGGVRGEWEAHDFTTNSGMKIEVKSAAYMQSWAQKKPSTITFNVRATRAWDADTNVQSKESKWQADIYVFALLHHVDKATIDPLNVSQWRFYVLSSCELNARSQKSITLKILEKLHGPGVKYSELSGAVESAAMKINP